jgi:hypothetical protein
VTLLTQIADWSWLAFALLLFVVQAAAHLIGYRLGMNHRFARGGGADGVGLIVGGIAGLLAFVLALTLSYANTRFGERRHAALEEANAIGTAWLRAEAINHQRGREIVGLLEHYTTQRKLFLQSARQSAELEGINKRTSDLQTQIWGHATAISHERPDPIAAALMQALNDVFDLSAAQRFAHEARLPAQMFWLLIGLALIAVGALGYQLGLKGQRTYILAGILIAVWTAVIVVILDISAPRIGSIRTAVSAYDWTLDAFKGGSPR